MAPTLYEPPRKRLFSGRAVKVLLVLLVVAGAGGYLYQRQPGWFAHAAASFLGLFGYELVTINVATTPTRANVLLDGERMTELPLRVRRDGGSHRVSAVAPGFEPTEVTFTADGDKHLILTLKPERRH